MQRPNKRRVLCGGIGVVLLGAAVAMWIAVPSITAQDQGGSPPQQQEVIFDWQNSSLHLMVSKTFEEAGHPAQEAADLATQALLAMDGLSYDVGGPPPEESEVDFEFLWRKSSIHLILSNALVSAGYPVQQASDLATQALWEMMAWEDGASQPIEPKCWVYPIIVHYCDGDDKKRLTKYIKGLCWEDINSLCVVPTCPVGKVPWYTLTKSSTCTDPEPSPGTCVWIRADGEPRWVSCRRDRYGCDCFLETNPIDCGAIEIICASKRAGPAGCPQCNPSP